MPRRGYSKKFVRDPFDGMTKTKQQEEALFDAARNLADPVARRAFLEQACAGDPESRARIEALLEAGTEAEDFFKEATSFCHSPFAGLDPASDNQAANDLKARASEC